MQSQWIHCRLPSAHMVQPTAFITPAGSTIRSVSPTEQKIKHNLYFVSSEDLPVSGNDNLSCTVNSHFTLQLKKIFGAAIIHIYQIFLHRKEKQCHGNWAFKKQNICFQKCTVLFPRDDIVIFFHFCKREPVSINTKVFHSIV